MAYQINDYYFNQKYSNAHQDDILHCDSNILSYNGQLKELNDSYTLLPGSSIDITRINVASMSDPVIMKSEPHVIYYLYDRLLWIKNYSSSVWRKF